MMSRSAPLRIGYFIQDFPPEVGAGPARVTEMATRWQAAGAKVTVVTGMPNRRLPDQPDGRLHPDYRGRLFMEEQWNGLRVLRSWLFTSTRRGFAWTLANNASFMLTSAMHAAARLGPVDVLIASSPPFFVHVAADIVRRILRVPMVLEIRDLWPDYLVQMGTLRNRHAQRALFSLERRLLAGGSHSVVVTDSFRARLMEKGVPAERVDVIPNGVDLANYYRIEEAPPLPALRKENGELIVGYLGTFGAGQGLNVAVEAAARLAERGAPVRFVLAGDGPAGGEIARHADRLGLHNLSISPPISKERTRAFYNACDVCLVPLAPLPIFQETVPSKIFEAMACERPVLACLAGEGARIVMESGGGIVCPPGDSDALAGGVLRMLEMSMDESERMGASGRAHVAAHYDRGVLAESYLALLQSVTEDRDALGELHPADTRSGHGYRRHAQDAPGGS